MRSYRPCRARPQPPSGCNGQCAKLAERQSSRVTYSSPASPVSNRSCTGTGPAWLLPSGPTSSKLNDKSASLRKVGAGAPTAADRAPKQRPPATDASHPKHDRARRQSHRPWTCGRCAGAHRHGPWTTWVHVAHRPCLRPHAHRLPPRSDQKTQSKGNAIAHCATGSVHHPVTHCGMHGAVNREGSWQPTPGAERQMLNAEACGPR